MCFPSANLEKNHTNVKKLLRRKPIRKILREQVQMGEAALGSLEIREAASSCRVLLQSRRGFGIFRSCFYIPA